MRQILFYPHLTDEETDTQKGYIPYQLARSKMLTESSDYLASRVFAFEEQTLLLVTLYFLSVTAGRMR